jgi:hypothetical protein
VLLACYLGLVTGFPHGLPAGLTGPHRDRATPHVRCLCHCLRCPHEVRQLARQQAKQDCSRAGAAGRFPPSNRRERLTMRRKLMAQLTLDPIERERFLSRWNLVDRIFKLVRWFLTGSTPYAQSRRTPACRRARGRQGQALRAAPEGAVLDRRCARRPHHRAGRDGRMAPPGAEECHETGGQNAVRSVSLISSSHPSTKPG